MVWRVLLLFFVFTTTTAEEALPTFDNVKPILPFMTKDVPLEAQRPNSQINQNVIQEINKPQQQNNEKLGQAAEIQPRSYKLYGVSSNDYAADRCSSSNSYFFGNLLPILSVFLEFLENSQQAEKAYVICELIKRYLENAPAPSQEKNSFLAKLKIVEEHLMLLKARGAHNHFPGYHPTNEAKTTIVFQKELPGFHQQNCRDTFGRLVQTAVNVYKETAKHPHCQPSGYVDENLYYPKFNVRPEKPYQFVVFYQNPPSSYYKPDLSGFEIYPSQGGNKPPLEHLYPSFIEKNPHVPSKDNIIQFFLPNGEHSDPLQPNKKHQDILELIKQYNILHPNSKPITYNPLLWKPGNNPYSPIHSDVPKDHPLFGIHGSANPDTHLTYVYPDGRHQIPGVNSNQLHFPNMVVQNPKLNEPSFPVDGFTKPEEIVSLPGQTHFNPYLNLFGIQSPPGFPGTLTGGNQFQPDVAPPKSNPELSLEILLSLLGQPGVNKQNEINPQLMELLKDKLTPNYPGSNQNYIALGPDGIPVQDSLSNYLNQLQQDPMTGIYSNNIRPDYETLLKNLQLAVSNGNKLPSSRNKANIIELTYVLQRPKPLIYRPIYYVKYRLPYQTFLSNYQRLILKKAHGLRSQSEESFKDIIAVSNISDVSPSLKGFAKEEILKMAFGNGTLVNAKVINIPDKVLNEQLEITRNLNAEVDPKVIEELSSNLGVNKSDSISKTNSGVGWFPKFPTHPPINVDLTWNGFNPVTQPIPLDFTNPKQSYLNGESSTYAKTVPQDFLRPNYPMN